MSVCWQHSGCLVAIPMVTAMLVCANARFYARKVVGEDSSYLYVAPLPPTSDAARQRTPKIAPAMPDVDVHAAEAARKRFTIRHVAGKTRHDGVKDTPSPTATSTRANVTSAAEPRYAPPRLRPRGQRNIFFACANKPLRCFLPLMPCLPVGMLSAHTTAQRRYVRAAAPGTQTEAAASMPADVRRGADDAV